jgi:hypothetical protein
VKEGGSEHDKSLKLQLAQANCKTVQRCVLIVFILEKLLLKAWTVQSRHTFPKKILATMVLGTILTQCCQAAMLAASPDGNWRVQTTAGDTVAIFNSGGQPVITLDRGIKGPKQLNVKWSGDSQAVVLLDQAPLGSGIIAAWSDGAKWHATVELDSDIKQVEALAEARGVSGELKAEQRTLGDWISPDTIQVHGILRYLGGKEFPYTYTLEVVPGSYGVNRGGFETGGLKASNFRPGK